MEQYVKEQNGHWNGRKERDWQDVEAQWAPMAGNSIDCRRRMN